MKNILQSASETERQQQGVALLAVLWLTVALSMMALATSYLVRTEVDAATNQLESERSYYLAKGGIDAAVYSLIRSATQPANPGQSGPPPEFQVGQRWLQYQFPGGSCMVEVTPENAKLNVNTTSEDTLAVLFSGLGLNLVASRQMAEAIMDWRTPRPPESEDPYELFYAGLPQPYADRHAAMEQVEELLPVHGMSRELFFGRAERLRDGSWQKFPPLQDLLTAMPPVGGMNLNYARPEALRALPGWDDRLAAAVVFARIQAPFQSWDDAQNAVPGLSEVMRLSSLTLLPGNVYTLTATGLLPDSKVRRSVRALMRVAPNLPLFHRVLAWWDDWPMANSDFPAERQRPS